MSKLDRIRALCEAHPDDPFGWYSLAMEQKKTDPDGALAVFARVHAEHPEYLPNFFHYAQALAQADELEQAADVYREGMALAKAQGNEHTRTELEAALDLID